MEIEILERRPFKWVGGWLCLDFVDSKNWDSHDPVYERFHGYEDLVRWNEAAGRLSELEGQQLLTQAAQQPTPAAHIFEQGLALRQVIHRVFATIAREDAPAEADLARLNEHLAGLLARSKINQISAEHGFTWAWAGPSDALERVLWPIAWSAAELLTSDKLGRVGQCAGESCGWLFLDTTRNRSRRWCEMEHCGNRAKAKRHYRRRKATA